MNPPASEILWHLIIPAGGSARRFGGDKLFREMEGRPLFTLILERYGRICPGKIVMAVPPAQQERFASAAARYCPGLEVCFVSGGATRTASVRSALEYLSMHRTGPDDYAAVHDAARPYATEQLLYECLNAARRIAGGAVPGKPVRDSLKRVDPATMLVTSAPDRNALWTVETPQVFLLEKLLRASAFVHDHDLNFTDDAGLFAAAGFPVEVVPYEGNNLKITYPEDLPQ